MSVRRKCDLCDKPATVHEWKVVKGQKIETHLCEEHAKQAGVAVKAAHTPINELLTNFVKLHAGVTEQQESTCENCGLAFAEFREHSLLGCPKCYTAFESQLAPLLERAHEGGTHHVGKIPKRGGSGQARQEQLLRMRKRLSDAVTAEDYELAARLRDEIRRFEESDA